MFLLFLILHRSNLSSRFAVTNEALNNLPEFPDLNVPILVDDILSKQPMDGIVKSNKLNRTEFIRQLEDFRWVGLFCSFLDALFYAYDGVSLNDTEKSTHLTENHMHNVVVQWTLDLFIMENFKLTIYVRKR